MLFSAEKFPTKDYLKIVTIFTNDMHGGIDRSEASFINPDFPPMLGGGAVAGRYILQKRQEAAQNGWGFLLIDAGDFYQGTPLGTVSEGEAVIEYMNTVGYDALTIGNHDFDNGWKNLKKLAEKANFPFLATNLYRKSTGELAEFVKPYIIKEIQYVYSSQGQPLNDKHVEIIARQMFSRYFITEAGDTNLLPGETVEDEVFHQANKNVKNASKGDRLLLGITKASLTTDSFLSCLLYTSPSPRDRTRSRMPSSA